MSVQIKGSGTIGGIDEGLNITGVTTATNFKTGVSNLHSTGLTLTGGQLDIGSNIKLGTAGVITATSFVGSGAQLTGITGTTINTNADNRIITGSGTANTLNGETNFTYDGGGNLTLNSTAHDGGFNILAANNNQETRLRLQGKASDGTGHSFYINAKRSSNRLDIGTASGAAISVMSNLNVGIQQSGPESPLQIGTGTNAVTNKSTVHVAPASGNASLTLRGGSPTIYFDGTGGGHTRLLTDNTDIAISNGNPDSTGNERFRLRAAGGLCFNGDTAEANALDDYEEGSWNPLWSNSAANSGGTTTSNNMHGRYTKIGKMVHAYFYTWGLPAGNSGNMYLQGLPFSCASNPGAFFCAVQSAFYNMGADNYYNLGLRLSTNRTFAELIFCRHSSGNYVPATFAGFINYYTNFNGVLTYEAA